VDTCLWEVFGDEILGGATALSLAAWTGRSISEVRIARSAICNLNSTAIRTAMGCDLTALFHNDLSIPQTWAEAIKSHPASFEGILYASRFTRKRCLALFSPPIVQNDLKRGSSTPLPDHPDALRFLAGNRLALV
jgi:hypothetical protein